MRHVGFIIIHSAQLGAIAVESVDSTICAKGTHSQNPNYIKRIC